MSARTVCISIVYAAAAAMLCGCSATGTEPASSKAAPLRGPAARAALASSVQTQSEKIPHGKKPTFLLYIPIAGKIYVYDYKSWAQIAYENEYDVYALCSDRKGDVYAVNYDDGVVRELAAGTLTVIKELSDSAGYATGCSVNPKNGDLAVTNQLGNDGSGNVLIYADGSGSPTKYTAQWKEWPAGYDPDGNLFVDGEGSTGCEKPCLEELPYGGSAFQTLTEHNFSVNSPTAVEWDGNYLGVGDENCNGNGFLCVREVSVSGTTAKRVNTVKLTDTCGGSYNETVWWANKSEDSNDLPTTLDRQIAAVNIGCKTDALGVWRYPAGGNPVRHFNMEGGLGGSPLIVKAVWK